MLPEVWTPAQDPQPESEEYSYSYSSLVTGIDSAFYQPSNYSDPSTGPNLSSWLSGPAATYRLDETSGAVDFPPRSGFAGGVSQ